jgi:hypothetical protein
MGRRYSGSFPLHLVQSTQTGLEEDGLSLQPRGMQVCFMIIQFVVASTCVLICDVCNR